MKKLLTILTLTATFACADDLDGRMPPVGGLAMVTTKVPARSERTSTIYVPGPVQVVTKTDTLTLVKVDTVVKERIVVREAPVKATAPVKNDYPTVSDAEAKAAKWLISAGYTWVPGKNIYYKATVDRTWDYEEKVYRRKMAVSHTVTTGAIRNTEVEVVCGVPALHTFTTGYVTPNGMVQRTGRTDEGEVVVYEGSVGYFLYEKACEAEY